jgi:hypothetical protein
MKDKFNKNKEFSLDELAAEISKNIYDRNFTVEIKTDFADQILFKTDKSRQDLYESIISHVKYLGFTTQPMRDSKPEFKIPKSTLRFKRNRQIEIKVVPRSGRLYLKSGWENPLIYDLKRYRKLPSNMVRTNPDNYAEYEILRKFNQLVDELCVDVTIGGKRFNSIAGMIPGPAGSKADFVGIDKDGDAKFYISHKEGSNATDFQQYSGISKRGAGTNISNHKEVLEFVKDIDSKPHNEVLEKAYWRPIKDERLKKYAVFGKNSDKGPSSPGVDNVDFFAQGNIILTSDLRNRRVKINFSQHLVGRNDLYKLGRGDYEPTLGTRKGEVSRKVGKHDSVRGGIWTSKYIKDRTSEEI